MQGPTKSTVSEAGLNKASLAQMAQSNDQTLNQKPIEAGLIIIHFDYEGFTYHFESDGTHFAWITMQQVLMEQT